MKNGDRARPGTMLITDAGQLEVVVGDQREIVRAGDCVLLPRGIPHRLQNAGPEPAQVLALMQPPGLEQFFEEIAQLRQQGSLTPETVRGIGARFGITRWGSRLRYDRRQITNDRAPALNAAVRTPGTGYVDVRCADAQTVDRPPITDYRLPITDSPAAILLVGLGKDW
jgi:Cupin domain